MYSIKIISRKFNKVTPMKGPFLRSSILA